MGSGSIWIVKEIYDSENAFDKFGQELDLALKKGVSTIVIEPPDLAEQTGRWISVGNFFHKAAVIFGLSSIIWSTLWPKQATIYICLTSCSAICTTIHAISWQLDPCCRYQVETNKRKLRTLQIPRTSTAVVLCKRDDKYRRFFHVSVCALSVGFCLFGVYRHRQ